MAANVGLLRPPGSSVVTSNSMHPPGFAPIPHSTKMRDSDLDLDDDEETVRETFEYINSNVVSSTAELTPTPIGLPGVGPGASQGGVHAPQQHQPYQRQETLGSDPAPHQLPAESPPQPMKVLPSPQASSWSDSIKRFFMTTLIAGLVFLVVQLLPVDKLADGLLSRCGIRLSSDSPPCLPNMLVRTGVFMVVFAIASQSVRTYTETS